MITTMPELLSGKHDRRRRDNRPRPLTAHQTIRDEMLMEVGSKEMHERRLLATIPEEEFDKLLSNRGGRTSSAAIYKLWKRDRAMGNLVEYLRIAQDNGCLEDVLDEMFATPRK